MVECNFNIQYSLFFMFLNFLMVLKPYISLYSLYGSITISKFKNQFQISQNLIFPYIPYMVECNFNNNFKVQKSISNFSKPYILLYSLYG